MFNNTYFAVRYFEPHYFAQSTAELTPAAGAGSNNGADWLTLLNPVME